MHLSYDGTDYSGWQWQANTSNTIQAIMTKVIGDMLRDTNIVLSGCGRTDSGVHASQYFVHFDSDKWIDEEEFVFIANKQLPNAIILHDLIPIHDNAHARYDAVERTYHYFVHLNPDPILSRYSSLYTLPNINIEAIQQAAGLSLGNRDFSTFCRKPDKHNTTLVDMKDIKIALNYKRDRIQFSFTANRFLKSQVRIMVDEFLQIGTGKSTIETYLSKLENKTQRPYETMAYPQGLHLSSVVYPYLKIENPSSGFILLDIT